MKDGLWTASDRKALRRRVRVPCQVVREDDFTLIGDACLDMSLQGMRVRALKQVPIATPVLVSFRVPDSGVHMDLSAVVSRIARGRRRGERSATLGLTFIDMTQVESVILGARLKGVPPPAPARHLRIDYAASVRAVHASAPA